MSKNAQAEREHAQFMSKNALGLQKLKTKGEQLRDEIKDIKIKRLKMEVKLLKMMIKVLRIGLKGESRATSNHRREGVPGDKAASDQAPPGSDGGTASNGRSTAVGAKKPTASGSVSITSGVSSSSREKKMEPYEKTNTSSKQNATSMPTIISSVTRAAVPGRELKVEDASHYGSGAKTTKQAMKCSSDDAWRTMDKGWEV